MSEAAHKVWDGQIRRNRRYMLWATYGRQCGYCGKPLAFGESTLDHKIPKSKGGDDRLSNLIVACEPCNQAKGARIVVRASLIFCGEG